VNDDTAINEMSAYKVTDDVYIYNVNDDLKIKQMGYRNLAVGIINAELLLNSAKVLAKHLYKGHKIWDRLIKTFCGEHVSESKCAEIKTIYDLIQSERERGNLLSLFKNDMADNLMSVGLVDESLAFSHACSRHGFVSDGIDNLTDEDFKEFFTRIPSDSLEWSRDEKKHLEHSLERFWNSKENSNDRCNFRIQSLRFCLYDVVPTKWVKKIYNISDLYKYCDTNNKLCMLRFFIKRYVNHTQEFGCEESKAYSEYNKNLKKIPNKIKDVCLNEAIKRLVECANGRRGGCLVERHMMPSRQCEPSIDLQSFGACGNSTDLVMVKERKYAQKKQRSTKQLPTKINVQQHQVKSLDRCVSVDEESLIFTMFENLSKLKKSSKYLKHVASARFYSLDQENDLFYIYNLYVSRFGGFLKALSQYMNDMGQLFFNRNSNVSEVVNNFRIVLFKSNDTGDKIKNIQVLTAQLQIDLDMKINSCLGMFDKMKKCMRKTFQINEIDECKDVLDIFKKYLRLEHPHDLFENDMWDSYFAVNIYIHEFNELHGRSPDVNQDLDVSSILNNDECITENEMVNKFTNDISSSLTFHSDKDAQIEQGQEQIRQMELQLQMAESICNEQLDLVNDKDIQIKQKMEQHEEEIKLLKERCRQLKNENRECCVCMDAIANIVFMPCRHLCACKGCADNLPIVNGILWRSYSEGYSKCPSCRKQIKGKINVF